MIFALVGQKGGSGKSTLSVSIAVELSVQGRNVLLVDADPQQTVVTWGDVATELGIEAPTVVAMPGQLHKPNQLPKLAKAYDDVVIDTPPRLGEIQRSALAVADMALIPCGASAPDAWSLAETLKTIDEVRPFRPELRVAIVINRKRAGTSAAKTARETLMATGIDVLETEIGLRQAFADAIAAGKGPTTWAPRDPASDEIRALIAEISRINTGAKSNGTRETAHRCAHAEA